MDGDVRLVAICEVTSTPGGDDLRYCHRHHSISQLQSISNPRHSHIVDVDHCMQTEQDMKKFRMTRRWDLDCFWVVSRTTYA